MAVKAPLLQRRFNFNCHVPFIQQNALTENLMKMPVLFRWATSMCSCSIIITSFTSFSAQKKKSFHDYHACRLLYIIIYYIRMTNACANRFELWWAACGLPHPLHEIRKEELDSVWSAINSMVAANRSTQTTCTSW